jgi:DNA-binding CsgD family transcriptional regulator
LTTVDSVPVTVLVGPAGIGRTTALAEARTEARAAGADVVDVRLAPGDERLPLHLLGLVGEQLTRLDGPAGRLGRDLGRPGGAVTPLAEPDIVVLIDDLHWADPASLDALAHLVSRLPQPVAKLRVVATAWASARTHEARCVAKRLRGQGLLRVRPLRPLTPERVAAVAAERLPARPHRSLVEHLVRVSAGVPGALVAAIEGYQRAGALRVVEHQVYLIDPAPRPELDALLRPLRQLLAPAWPVAKAAAVLHPLGPRLSTVAAEVLGRPLEQVEAGLADLVTARVLRVGPDGWRFTVPLVAEALRGALGPFERRRFAQAAVAQHWDAAAPVDGSYLAERLVDAGGFVDGERAGAELLAAAHDRLSSDGPTALRWLSAAEQSGDSDTRLAARLGKAAVGQSRGDLDDVRRLLEAHSAELDPHQRHTAQVIYVHGLRGAGDVDTLARLADGTGRLPGGGAPSTVTRAIALCAVDRWADAARLLSGSTSDGSAAVVLATASALLGRPSSADDVDPALYALLGLEAPPSSDRPGLSTRDTDRILHAWRAGRWDEASEIVQLRAAAGGVDGSPLATGAVPFAVAEIRLEQGWPSRARATIETARAQHVPLAHLLDLADATIDWHLGLPAAAAGKVAAGLTAASRSGFLFGTCELWLLRARSATQLADHATAARALDETSRRAEALGTPAGRLAHLLTRVVVRREAAAASEALTVARSLGQPLALADTLETVATHDLGAPSLLLEAYELAGQLGALLRRARLRQLMREHAAGQPNRAETLAENERLIAHLVAEGLSNKDIAVALRTSEKSVEGRLTRLFSRTGYRSRVELATAILTLQYSAG